MRIPFFGIGKASRSKTVTAKVIQNLYMEQRPAGEKSSIVAYGTPGLELFISFGDTPIRGWIAFPKDDVFYAIHRGTLWEVNNAGVKTSIGVLDTVSGKVQLSHNGTQIIIIDGTFGYIYNTATNTYTKITDIDFPSSPGGVSFQDGYFIVNQSTTGRYYISSPYDGTLWDGLDFANAETSPDPLVNNIADHGELMLFGSSTTEFHGNNGSTDFPYSRIQGSAAEWGLAAKNSLAKYDNSVAALFKNRMGQVMIAKMAGYVPEKISTPDMDDIINNYTSVSDASAFSYMLGGHPFYWINFPSEGYSWMFDGTNGSWTALKSYGLTRHRGEMGLDYLNRTLISDYSNGNVYRLSQDVYSDNGDMIEREVISENVCMPDLEDFVVSRFRVDVEVGVGLTTGQGVDPQIMLQVSTDNGKTWGAEMWQSMGKIGEYTRQVEWGQLGQARSFNFKLRVTDPVKVTLVNAIVNPED